jgi:hypothetical protein
VLYALLFLPALAAVGWLVLRPRPARVLAVEAARPEPAAVTGDADPIEAIDALLAELERGVLDERDVRELDALAARLEEVAAELERVG